MSNHDFDLLMAEVYRLRQDAKAQLDMEVRQVPKDAADRLEKLAQRLEYETAATLKRTMQSNDRNI